MPTYEEALRFFGARFTPKSPSIQIPDHEEIASPLKIPVKQGHWVCAPRTLVSHKIICFEVSMTPFYMGQEVAKYWCGAVALRENLRLAGRNPCELCIAVYSRHIPQW